MQANAENSHNEFMPTNQPRDDNFNIVIISGGVLGDGGGAVTPPSERTNDRTI